jgi:hypothetical protein
LAAGTSSSNGELAVDRHDLVADLVGRAVQADGQAEAQFLVGQLEDLGHDPGGGDGDPAGPEAEAPGGVHGPQGRQQVIIVGQGLAHAHDDDIIEGSQPLGGPDGIGLILDPADLDQLGHDFTHGKVPFPSFQTGSAEFTAVGAPHLGGNADGPTGLLLPHPLHRGADDDRLDQGAVPETLEYLLGDIRGGFLA